MQSLLALADGKLDQWHGLGLCQHIDAESALGSSGAAPGPLGSYGVLRRYPARPAAPRGVRVWMDGPDITLVEINEPKLHAKLNDLLGAPEGKETWGLGGVGEHLIYASRGLSALIDVPDGSLVRIYAFKPMTLEEFLASDLVVVEDSLRHFKLK